MRFVVRVGVYGSMSRSYSAALRCWTLAAAQRAPAVPHSAAVHRLRSALPALNLRPAAFRVSARHMSAKASSDVGQRDREEQGKDQPMQQQADEATTAAGSNASNVSDGSDGSNGQGDKKEESSGPGGEEEEEGPTNPWLVLAAVVGVGAALSYWFVEELKDDEDLRENMSDDYPEVCGRA